MSRSLKRALDGMAAARRPWEPGEAGEWGELRERLEPMTRRAMALAMKTGAPHHERRAERLADMLAEASKNEREAE